MKLNEARILVADDTPDVLNLFQTMLRGVVGQLDTAHNGKSAAEKFCAATNQGKPYNLVILDIAMPDMSGFEVARVMRECEPNVHIAFFTAYDRVMNQQGAEDLDAVAYWTKPIWPDAFIEELQGIIERRKCLNVPPGE